MPATSASKYSEAVFPFTPTALTQLTRDSLEALPGEQPRRDVVLKYWPTPMLFGSTFTSSASGSCRRRAIEIAPQIVMSWSRNSSRATSLAL